MKLAQRISRIEPSPTLAIDTKAKQMQAQGLDVLNFGAGEPDFDTPVHVKKAAIAAIEAGKSKYTAVPGSPDLIKALVAFLKRDTGVEYQANQIITSNGGKHSLFNLSQVLFEEGDEVIIPTPYWVSYKDMVAYAGAKPVFVESTDQTGFRVSAEQIKNAITAKTKALMINSPSNPTGSAYSREELRAIADVCGRANIFIISDEIYDKITYDGFVQTSMISLGPDVVEKTILVNGASKAFAMTGWRMGFAAGPTEIIAAMAKLQGQSTSNISSITQAACVEAFTATPTFLKDWVAEYQKRRNIIVDALNQIPGISCYKPQGAFYVFPNIAKILGRKTPRGVELKTSADFCAHLLEDHLVACVPGHAFGAEGYLRISYATSQKIIEDGMKRIAKAVMMLV